MDDLIFSKASDEDSSTILTLLQETQNWTKAKGFPMWNHMQFSTDDILNAIQEHDIILLKVDGKTASLMFLQETDEDVWAEKTEQKDAFYIHRLCTKYEWRGLGLSKRMIEFAKQYAAQAGKSFLRLDCATNEKLMNIYKACGFEHIDNSSIDGFQIARFELKLSP